LSSIPDPSRETIAEGERAGGTGERLLVIKELDAGDGKPGRTLGLTEIAFQPLDYATLADARLDEGTVIPSAINSARVVDTDIEGLPIGSRSRCSPVEALLPGVTDEALAAIGLSGAGTADD
jgi:hypothetical protein